MLKKVTAGFVIQEFDPDLKKFVSQEFVCGDEVTYEDTDADEETEPNLNELIDSFDGKCPENIEQDLWDRLREIVG